MQRRDFLKLTSAATAGWLLSPAPVMAGPFVSADWDSYIPADKKLHPDWVKSLFARGEPTTYTKSRGELRYLGMPVGGIGCGTMYLGGDGRLWCWDIFNQNREGILAGEVPWSETGFSFGGSEKDAHRKFGPRDGANYVRPRTREQSPAIQQGFALRTTTAEKTSVRSLAESDWAEVRFTGQYPVGIIEYSDPASPVSVKLEAFSPFIPLNADDSGLPATIFSFKLCNTSSAKVTTEIAGWLQNAASFYSANNSGVRKNMLKRGRSATLIAMEYQPAPPEKSAPRPDIVVENFESDYALWKVEGEAFGKNPMHRANVPEYQGDLGGEGDAVANSHASAPANDVGPRDNCTGSLTSKPFKLQRKFLTFYIGGGKDQSQVGMRLLVDGKVVATAAGRDENHMRRASFDIVAFEGRDGVLEIYDHATGPWGHIGVDHIVQTDEPKIEPPLEARGDFGTLALALIGKAKTVNSVANKLPQAAFESGHAEASAKPNEKVIGALSASVVLAPGETKEVNFILAWHFPNSGIACPDAKSGNYYAKRFSDAVAVATYIAADFARLAGDTRLWRDTWADSTLPHWLLERTFVNTSTLATSTSHRFATGRFWAWEGVGCCHGTCTHVWQYAQAVGRIFPELERDLRERVDFGVALEKQSGFIRYRGEGSGPAIDGHCGRILGVWREHLMSTDEKFLRRIWPNVKLAAQYLLQHDANADGLLDGPQDNTLDAAWFGDIAWLSGLGIAALRATEEMARVVGDEAFAEECRVRFEKGRAAIETKLWNGEYFIQLPEAGRENNLGTYQGCHIDQVFGQSWAWQVALGRVLDPEKTRSALRALWKYNFAPDVGPFRAKRRDGRPYALAGDAGLVMATNPQLLPKPFGAAEWQSGYFNECMSGFEHQVASHMLAEGMVLEGLAVTRAIHDRYHARSRNPFNEIECSDHYARAMASFGTFISACGFECNGPRGHIGFAPRLTPDNFRAAFTSAEGWGTFAQQINATQARYTIEIHRGQLNLKTIAVELPGQNTETLRVQVAGKAIKAAHQREGQKMLVHLEETVRLAAGTKLEILFA